MNKYNFDIHELDFDIDELIAQIEEEHGRMIVRIPKMEHVAPFIYEFTAIFSDFSLLEAKMLIVPQFTHEGMVANIRVRGIYL